MLQNLAVAEPPLSEVAKVQARQMTKEVRKGGGPEEKENLHTLTRSHAMAVLGMTRVRERPKVRGVARMNREVDLCSGHTSTLKTR
mmetsp:Transcript_20908/g.38165  ORF Transcript_20908/g.38165 Transcript_20908/m.38165 type:complete len:86 (+) Transcript_20908:434-691(+)